MRIFRPYVSALLLLTLLVSTTLFAQTTLRKDWRSSRYSPAAIPSQWHGAAPKNRELAVFQNFDFPHFSVRAVIDRFGTPDRYLVSRREHDSDFLIYDLPSGHSVALYVSRPPQDHFAAAVIIDASGKDLRLVK